VLEKAQRFLGEGKGLWEARLSPDELSTLAPLALLTAKPVLYAANVTDAGAVGRGRQTPPGRCVPPLRRAANTRRSFPSRPRSRRSWPELPQEDRADFLASLGLESAGLDRLIRAGYHLMGLQTYFTAGEQEVRAWTIHHGDTAPVAAGVIHTDFERGFIRGETVGYDEFVSTGGWKGAKEKGVVRSEGKEYVVRDGDVMLFRFNV
jgi:ribosome-binding ATPase YchF (GTP1/OBG family)